MAGKNPHVGVRDARESIARIRPSRDYCCDAVVGTVRFSAATAAATSASSFCAS